MPSPYELRPDDTHGGGDVRRRRDGPRRWRTRWWRARWWRNAYPGYAALTKVLAALPQTLTLLSFQPFLRHSPLSGTLHSSRPGVPVPLKTNRNASKGPAVFRANKLAPGRPRRGGGSSSSGRSSRPSAFPRAGRIARPETDEDPLRAVQVLPRSPAQVQTYGFGTCISFCGAERRRPNP